MAERVLEPTETPAMLVPDWTCLPRPRRDCGLEQRLGIIDDKQHPSGRSPDLVRAESVQVL